MATKLKCPACGARKSRVLASPKGWTDKAENRYVRPRKCLDCDEIYYTCEILMDQATQQTKETKMSDDYDEVDEYDGGDDFDSYDDDDETETYRRSDGRPDEMDFETYAEYMEALADWKTDQKLKQLPQAQPSGPTPEQQARQAAHFKIHGDLSDPFGQQRREINDAITERLNLAAKAKAYGDYTREKQHLEVVDLYQKDLDALPAHPGAESLEADVLSTIEADLDEAKNDPWFIINTAEEIGMDKLLANARRQIMDFNKGSTGTTFWYLEKDSGVHGPIKELTRKNLKKVDVEDQRIADEIRYELQSRDNRTIFDMLAKRRLIEPVKDEPEPPKKPKKKSKDKAPKHTSPMSVSLNPSIFGSR